MKIFAGLCAAAVLATTGGAGAQQIAGNYHVAGKTVEGRDYAGTARIETRSTTDCRIRWNTGRVSQGVCRMNDGKFVATLKDRSGQPEVVTYDVMSDGRLNGVVTVADKKGSGREVLTPIR
ncbi:hypothetical protein [Jiella sp. M17.18]|uniref:hypothetical protein n=1 Tax=Jiella sp. M17.18 TaxID=3234247 RepID=UPI0034E049CE